MAQKDNENSGTGGLGALTGFAGYHLRRASNVAGAVFTAAVEGLGLRQVPFGILCVIAANPGINQGAVGRVLGIQRANMVALVNDLLEAGLVERVPDPRDRRAFVLSLSPAGTALVAEAGRRIAEREAAMLAGLSAAERAQLMKLLARIEAHEP